ncbi:asparaginase [Paucibacter sp. KBW04]|uniref:asparaginase n=1 Tax=Paucibacter sp. KBW04 TaxID=2153361 RepID=UPI000F584756|nr:asparaginase [Paucibacter sp. KBW04]RQO58728.1 asparaginase [Paucibacter sp. KBW04]
METHEAEANQVVVLGTGGTIAGTAADPGDNVGYQAAQLGVAQLVSAVPALAAVSLACEQVAQLDSKDMDFATWRQLAIRVAAHLAREDVAGVVITHGTDTLEETAYFLQRVLAPKKPVILTAAMRPATALQTDGPQNLLDAVAVAQDPQASGVLVVFAGVIHAAEQVRKAHSYRVDAFVSSDGARLGLVEEGQVRWVQGLGQARPGVGLEVLPTAAKDWPRVEILLNHVASDGRLVRALLAQSTDDKPGGLVVAGTGNGSLSQDLEAALREAQAQGVRVLRSTRCDAGPVTASADALPSAGALSPVKARVELILQLLNESKS